MCIRVQTGTQPVCVKIVNFGFLDVAQINADFQDLIIREICVRSKKRGQVSQGLGPVAEGVFGGGTKLGETLGEAVRDK